MKTLLTALIALFPAGPAIAENAPVRLSVDHIRAPTPAEIMTLSANKP